jgi:hypothetical protein
LLPHFEESNWTSGLRICAWPGIEGFSDGDSFADFTYYDIEGKLAQLLDIPVEDGPKTFLVEVKTSKAVEDGFYCSPRQLTTVFS